MRLNGGDVNDKRRPGDISHALHHKPYRQQLATGIWNLVLNTG